MTIQPISAALLAAALAFSLPAQAHGVHADAAPGKEQVVPMQRQALPDAPGKFGLMATVIYAPGQESLPHRHPGSVFAYVLEGEVISQLDGGKEVSYKAGQSWYETPLTPHTVSRNASKTRPARLLVWLLVADGDEVTIPLAK